MRYCAEEYHLVKILKRYSKCRVVKVALVQWHVADWFQWLNQTVEKQVAFLVHYWHPAIVFRNISYRSNSFSLSSFMAQLTAIATASEALHAWLSVEKLPSYRFVVVSKNSSKLSRNLIHILNVFWIREPSLFGACRIMPWTKLPKNWFHTIFTLYSPISRANTLNRRMHALASSTGLWCTVSYIFMSRYCRTRSFSFRLKFLR